MTNETDRSHDDVIKWKHFPRYWPFVRGIHRWPVNSPAQRPVTRSFDVFFDLRLYKRLRKQSWGWWFETLSRPLWRHSDVFSQFAWKWESLLFGAGVTGGIPSITDLHGRRMCKLHGWSMMTSRNENIPALLAVCAGNSPVTGEFPSQSQWRGALMFSLICVWTNGWANHRDAGDLRRHHIHYDVTVMSGYTSTILQYRATNSASHCFKLTTAALNTLRPRQKKNWPPFCRRLFEVYFPGWRFLNF